MSAIGTVQPGGAIDDWFFCKKHKVLDMRSAIDSVQPGGAIDDWPFCSRHKALELMSAIGACSAEGRHRRLVPLQQARGAGVDV